MTVSTINCNICSQKPNCSCLECGCNTLNVYVWVPCGCPVGICMNVKQDTTNCYNCDREPRAFYNRKTCRCECASQCKSCTNYLQQWYDYPTCGCMCNRTISCPYNQWFNKQTCQCECSRICCPKGMVQDPKNCQCSYGVSGCWPPLPCTGGVLNRNTCQCEYAKDSVVLGGGGFTGGLGGSSTIVGSKPCPPPPYNCPPRMFYDLITCSCQYSAPDTTLRPVALPGSQSSIVCDPPALYDMSTGKCV